VVLVQVDGGVDGSKTQGDEEQRQQDSTLRKKASEALAQMLSAELRHVAGRLTDMLAKSKVSPSRVRAARTLECLCSHISTEHGQPPGKDDAIEMLTKVLTRSFQSNPRSVQKYGSLLLIMEVSFSTVSGSSADSTGPKRIKQAGNGNNPISLSMISNLSLYIYIRARLPYLL
jgi:hypothetical protein